VSRSKPQNAPVIRICRYRIKAHILNIFKDLKKNSHKLNYLTIDGKSHTEWTQTMNQMLKLKATVSKIKSAPDVTN
jgi:hypothetical protein